MHTLLATFGFVQPRAPTSCHGIASLGVIFAQRPLMSQPVSSGPTSDPSEVQRLASPNDYKDLIASASSTDITVVKWAADYCRTCRAAAPKIRSLLKKFKTEQPNARFFSMDLKAIKDSSQDEMVDYFQSRNVTKMPYIELYVGQELVQSLVVPPARVAFLRNALSDAASRFRSARRQRFRRRLVLQARANSHERAALARRRSRLIRQWLAERESSDASASSTASSSSRGVRKRHLLELRALESQRRNLRDVRGRLARKRRLFNTLVLGHPKANRHRKTRA